MSKTSTMRLSCKQRRKKSTQQFKKRYYYRLKGNYDDIEWEYLDCAYEFRKGLNKTHPTNPPCDIKSLHTTRGEWKIYKTLLGFFPYGGIHSKYNNHRNLRREPSDE